MIQLILAQEEKMEGAQLNKEIVVHPEVQGLQVIRVHMVLVLQNQPMLIEHSQVEIVEREHFKLILVLEETVVLEEEEQELCSTAHEENPQLQDEHLPSTAQHADLKEEECQKVKTSISQLPFY